MVSLPYPCSADSLNQETFLAPSAVKRTRSDDKECSDDHPPITTWYWLYIWKLYIIA